MNGAKNSTKKTKKTKIVLQQQGQPRRVLQGGSQESWAALSSYLQTILAPHVCQGVKIPDANTAPSFTATGTHRLQIQTATAGLGPISAMLLVRVGYTEIGAISGSFDLFLQTGGALAGDFVLIDQRDKVYAAPLNAVASLTRPVSCGLFCSFQGDTLTDRGRFFVAFIPPGFAGTLPPPNQTELMQLPYLKTFPLKAMYGQTVFLPIDEIARQYITAGGSPAGASRAGGNYGYLLVGCDGAASGQTLEFTVVENFEALPLNNQISFATPSPSKSDPIELAVASNVIASNPAAGVSQPVLPPQEAQAMIPSGTGIMHKSSSGPGLMDRIISGIGSVAKHVPAALAAAAPLLAAL